jgi:hypothetical protein
MTFRRLALFACLSAFVLFADGCRPDQPPAVPAVATAKDSKPASPPRIFCDHGEIRASSWSLSSVIFTNASIKPREKLTLVLETSRDTFKVPLKRSGTHPQDPYHVDPKYSDILLPREGEGVIEVVKSDGNFAAFCGVGLRYSMLPHF